MRIHPDVVLSRGQHHICPEAVPLLGEFDGAQLQQRCPRGAFPAHAAATEPRFDEFFATRFGDAAANRESGPAKFGITHVGLMLAKIVDLARHRLAHARRQPRLLPVARQGT